LRRAPFEGALAKKPPALPEDTLIESPNRSCLEEQAVSANSPASSDYTTTEEKT
jgi:hypothetical protein